MSVAHEVALAIYIVIAVVLLLMGGTNYSSAYGPEERRGPARLMLAAPVWPLAAVALLPVALAVLIRDATYKEGE